MSYRLVEFRGGLYLRSCSLSVEPVYANICLDVDSIVWAYDPEEAVRFDRREEALVLVRIFADAGVGVEVKESR